MTRITPFIAYTGCAEEAVTFYISVFPDSHIESVEYFTEGERGVPGKVKKMCFSVMGSTFMAMDFMVMNESDAPMPSWLISLFATCTGEAMFDTVFAQLSREGKVLMGPVPYENYTKVAWLTDKYGITWQLVCA